MSPEIHLDSKDYSFEQWNGHDFSDDCGGTEVASIGFVSQLGEIIIDKKMFMEAGRLLNKFLTNPNHVPIRTFKRGEEFNAEIYSHGTIIRYELSKMWSNIGSKREISKEIFWGVIMDDSVHGFVDTSIVSYKQNDIIKNNVNPLNGIRLNPVINIDVIDHHRELQNGKVFFESIEKVDWLQRMSTGMGVAISMPYRSSVFTKGLQAA